MWKTVVLSALLLTFTLTSPPPNNELTWQCGNEQISTHISERMIDFSCPHMKDAINQCCIEHDRCYRKQKGKNYCDDTFCNCLNIFTIESDVCYKKIGPMFCEVVKQFGDESYQMSNQNTPRNDINMITENIKDVINTSWLLLGDFKYDSIDNGNDDNSLSRSNNDDGDVVISGLGRNLMKIILTPE
ncbi:hypothetical protein DICVIV_05890 [Dictyocaulus viviparus]|uniref:Phospholipase A2 n=1 Tax=Dictyocaulus viviparus TaxID=29172 RepID=A0A0D8XTP4_DICVI|nr:hypothetical protein DICVIV_05890 [Dictyocaulus viviparus]